MKFELGDRVHYTSKSPKYDFTGTVIGWDSNWNGGRIFLIEPDSEQESKGSLWFGAQFLNRPGCRLGNHFENNHTKVPSVWLTGKAKGLKHGMYDYTPTQEGDKEDDI